MELDDFLTHRVLEAIAEYGPGIVDNADFRADLWDELSQADEVSAEADAFLAGPVVAAMLEAARQPAPVQPVGSNALNPEPEPAREPMPSAAPPGEIEDGGVWEWVLINF